MLFVDRPSALPFLEFLKLSANVLDDERNDTRIVNKTQTGNEVRDHIKWVREINDRRPSAEASSDHRRIC